MMALDADRGCHAPWAGLAGCQVPAEVERAELEPRSAIACSPLAAGRFGQREGEWLALAARPFVVDVGCKKAVVPSGQLHAVPAVISTMASPRLCRSCMLFGIPNTIRIIAGYSARVKA